MADIAYKKKGEAELESSGGKRKRQEFTSTTMGAHDRPAIDASTIVPPEPKRRAKETEEEEGEPTREDLQPRQGNAWVRLTRETNIKQLCEFRRRRKQLLAKQQQQKTEVQEGHGVGAATPDALFVLKDTDTLRMALEGLAKYNVLSAPVVRVGADPAHHVLGFVDVLDIAGFTLNKYGQMSDDFFDEKLLENEFFKTPVIHLLNYSQVDETVTIHEMDSVSHLIAVFNAWKLHRLHRLAVLNSEGLLIDVVTQSDIVSFAYDNLDLIPVEVRHKSLLELGMIQKPVFVRIDEPFVEALRTLYEHRVSGIALLDNEGRISANFSASDLRGLSAKAFQHFLGTTLSFMVKGTQAALGPPISLPDTARVEDAIRKLAETRVHRVYISDQQEHIHGVVSLSDLMPFIEKSQSQLWLNQQAEPVGETAAPFVTDT